MLSSFPEIPSVCFFICSFCSFVSHVSVHHFLWLNQYNSFHVAASTYPIYLLCPRSIIFKTNLTSQLMCLVTAAGPSMLNLCSRTSTMGLTPLPRVVGYLCHPHHMIYSRNINSFSSLKSTRFYLLSGFCHLCCSLWRGHLCLPTYASGLSCNVVPLCSSSTSAPCYSTSLSRDRGLGSFPVLAQRPDGTASLTWPLGVSIASNLPSNTHTHTCPAFTVQKLWTNSVLEPSTKHSASHGRFSGHAGHMLRSVSTGQTWAELSTSRKPVYILGSIVGIKFITWATFGFYQISSDSWVNGSISVLTDKNSLHETD